MALFTRSPDARRERRLRSTPPGPLHDYLSVPFPSPRTPLDELGLLAIDLETTGLDPHTDRVLSIGFVPVDGTAIRLGGAREIVVRPGGEHEVGESATVHGLTDDAVAGGAAMWDAVALTLEALRGRALLAHHAAIEVDFLTVICRKAFGVEPVFPVVDTLRLGHDLLVQGDEDVPRGRLRLHALRAQFGLPRYRAHHALTDALACAELYLALTAELGRGTFRQVAATR